MGALLIVAFSGIQEQKRSVRLRRPGSFLLLAQKKRTKEKGLPRQGKPAVGKFDGIFRHGIPAVAKNGGHLCPPPSGSPCIVAAEPVRPFAEAPSGATVSGAVELPVAAEAAPTTAKYCHFERSEKSRLGRARFLTAFGMTACVSLGSRTVSRPVGRRTWMCGVFRHGRDAVSENPLTLPARGFALSGKAFFFGSFLLTLIKRNEPAEGGSFCFWPMHESRPTTPKGGKAKC
ncbi:hypothetical protein FQY83_10015 [Luteimonas marina]|uniref:Uncharacterized protein n=1 Tax=Luteimonas marina TaxID=488485 RepID=A0A5C5U2Q9_9GAMM|nr:hypothetical protein [Luteimonas marina]TWT20079.1 hypothetical protein FQY83_10015 [Luteimonas marina]